jgi:2-methylisocitrate lyase-like PEP mutase family enzyme
MANYLGPIVNGPRRLRELLASATPVLAPGVYDALGARLVEEAGFGAAYMTGFGTAASLLGRPDVGLVTMSEMVDQAHRIARACALPVIADADTGYGNAINVVRTVQEFEQAGVAGIHLEDQITPKKCGHMDRKQVISTDEMLTKLQAAIAARQSPDLMIIARTDARAVEGLPAALDRARRYRDAGADMLFVEAATSDEEIETIATTLSDVPLLFNWAEGGKTPPIPYERLRQLGFALVIFPISTLLTAVASIRRALAEIATAGSPIPIMDALPPFAEFLEFIGLPEINHLEQQFLS